jgi:DNA-directed RNA polymerase specialized sigma24 family protein
MAWNGLNLYSENGLPISDEHRQIILNAAENAILKSEHDPNFIIRAAKRVARRLHLIENVRAYTTRAMTTARHQAAREQWRKEPQMSHREMDAVPDLSRRDDIENRLLVRELLDSLSDQDREIVLRRVRGEACTDIESDMNLKPRTAETRFRAAKTALRQFARTLDKQTGPRGR